MRKQFHYYAVRYLTNAMGFSDSISQWIAATSQYVDDCTKVDETHTYTKDTIPKDIMIRGLYKEIGGNIAIPIPRTALSTQAENTEYQDRNNQYNSLIPFHYYPPKKLPYPPEKYVDKANYYYVRSMDNFNTTSLKDIIINSADQYQKAISSGAEKDAPVISAIRIGVIVHVISDTFAHRYFSGVESFVNDTLIKQIQDNITMEDLRSQYPENAILLGKPKVGSARVGHSVDDMNVVLAMFQRAIDDPQKPEDPKDPGYIRSNGHTINTAEDFVDAAYELYQYFLLIRKEADPDDLHWKGLYLDVIHKMALMRNKSDAEFEKLLRDSLGTTTSYQYDFFKTTSDLTDKVTLISEYALVVDDVRNSIRLK